MQTFIYTLRPIRLSMLTDGPNEKETEILDNHVKYLAGLTEAGIVFTAGRTATTDANTFGLVLFRADDRGFAMQVMNADPAVQNGLMEATLSPFRFAMWSDRNPLAEA